MIDRTKFQAQGFDGAGPGALGEFLLNDGTPLVPKTVIWFETADHVHLNPPGGGGYGDPWTRDPQRVLDDVVNGYVTIEGAARDYGVVIHYLGTPGQRVRLPSHYVIESARGSLVGHPEARPRSPP